MLFIETVAWFCFGFATALGGGKLPNNNPEIAVFDWNVDSSTNSHQCLRAEIIDWTVPTEIDPAIGDTVALFNRKLRILS